ncbi:hypothetical protein F4778DRAFT_784841 [Xylariomycetidae sp. FL2044]|nr:hypothetical protein F4778DRAFT_784841 [Xylariomycetidae sp. FL2044]
MAASLNQAISALSEALPDARTREHVSTFVTVVNRFAGDVQFAVRAAGQQPLPGCTNIRGGITVELRLLDGIDIKGGYVQVGAGLGVAGGRSTICVIGGLAAQGGLSFFSTREGFICDNVINFEELSSPPGRSSTPAQKRDPELWVALRRGGNIFGITHLMLSLGLMCSSTLQPYAVSLLEEGKINGGNSLDLDSHGGPVVNVLLLTYWADKEDDTRVLAFQKALNSYGGENADALRRASRKCDPEGLFQRARPGGFKLFS